MGSKMTNDLGSQELIGLFQTDVIERARRSQPLEPSPRQRVHRQLTVCIVPRRASTNRFVQHVDWQRAVDIGNAVNQYSARICVEIMPRIAVTSFPFWD